MDLLTDPRAWLVVLGLSVVGIAISLGTYETGRCRKSAVRARFSLISDERWDQVEQDGRISSSAKE
jgi:hypothetical protein